MGKGFKTIIPRLKMYIFPADKKAFIWFKNPSEPGYGEHYEYDISHLLKHDKIQVIKNKEYVTYSDFEFKINHTSGTA